MQATRQQRIKSVRRMITSLAATATIGAAALVVAGQPASAAATGTATFSTPGAVAWTVPAGVNTAVFRVQGAGGGWASQTWGGAGAEVDAVVPVIPGDTYTLVVGAAGQSTKVTSSSAPGGVGGYGGGGTGGSCGRPVDGECISGAGGGGESGVYAGNTSV